MQTNTNNIKIIAAVGGDNTKFTITLHNQAMGSILQLGHQVWAQSQVFKTLWKISTDPVHLISGERTLVGAMTEKAVLWGLVS